MILHSLRSRLLALWMLLLASAGATGYLLFKFYTQSAAVQVAQAELAVARACREVGDRHAFFVSGWGSSVREVDAGTQTLVLEARLLRGPIQGATA